MSSLYNISGCYLEINQIFRVLSPEIWSSISVEMELAGSDACFSYFRGSPEMADYYLELLKAL